MSVYVSCPRRLNMDSEPPPEANPPVRSTVAMPLSIDSPSSRVPAGIDVPTPAALSGSEGPARSEVTAAVPTRTVKGSVRFVWNNHSP